MAVARIDDRQDQFHAHEQVQALRPAVKRSILQVIVKGLWRSDIYRIRRLPNNNGASR